jgi:hypothetical protein
MVLAPGGKVVPGERIELPTNGLQNRCSTAELTRLGGDLAISGLAWPPKPSLYRQGRIEGRRECKSSAFRVSGLTRNRNRLAGIIGADALGRSE